MQCVIKRITIDPIDPEWDLIQDDYKGEEWEDPRECAEDNNNSLSLSQIQGNPKWIEQKFLAKQ